VPCGVVSVPRRAAPSAARRLNSKGDTGIISTSVAKLRVGVIFGGRSGEHEVSIASAAAIFKHLDPARYDAVPIKIAKDGRWALGTAAPKALSAADVHKQAAPEALVPVDPSAALEDSRVDVVFPVLHGPYGEDGTVQGLLELANVPYVGAGVLGSAVGMDKAVMKALFAADSLPIVPHLTVLRRDWERAPADITGAVARDLRYPVFVKPANLGSSVGISKAISDESLAGAMRLAFEFDRKVVVEAGVPDAREIECAVLGNDDPEASVPGEIIVTHADGFYAYAAQYLDPNGASWQIPADIAPETAAVVRRLSVQAFKALELAGMARVDFFLGRQSGAVFLNEVNTIPGFTTISMYPKMWEASGLSYPALLDRLIALAIERHAEKQRLRTSVT
jgi:D-alanine-D-alanine ligase